MDVNLLYTITSPGAANLKYARWSFALVRPGRMLCSYHSQFRFEIVFNPDKGN
ncbi:hypothetical protein [Pedobacter sp.]|uniref:hypothetical protein n=1 Tax=Pedobacter sp. TaxID=1411316 RepID=UPI003D13340C